MRPTIILLVLIILNIVNTFKVVGSSTNQVSKKDKLFHKRRIRLEMIARRLSGKIKLEFGDSLLPHNNSDTLLLCAMLGDFLDDRFDSERNSMIKDNQYDPYLLKDFYKIPKLSAETIMTRVYLNDDDRILVLLQVLQSNYYGKEAIIPIRASHYPSIKDSENDYFISEMKRFRRMLVADKIRNDIKNKEKKIQNKEKGIVESFPLHILEEVA